MKQHIQKAREILTDIAKSLATENFDAATSALETMTTELDALHKWAETAEATIAELEKNLAENPAETTPEATKTEEVQKSVDLNIWASSLPDLMKEIIDAVKLQGEAVVGLQKSFDSLSTGTSKQDKTEEIQKSASALDELASRLGV